MHTLNSNQNLTPNKDSCESLEFIRKRGKRERYVVEPLKSQQSYNQANIAANFLGIKNELNFIKILSNIGGKNFGELVQGKLVSCYKNQILSIVKEGEFKKFILNNVQFINSSFYKKCEKTLLNSSVYQDYLNTEEADRPSYSKLKEKLPFEIIEEIKKVQALINDYIDPSEKLILRASTTSEDWLSDRLAGVTRSCFLNFDKYSNLESSIWYSIESVLFSKLGDKDFIKLYSDEALAFQVAPYVKYDHHVTAVCEEDDTVRIEVKSSKNKWSPCSILTFFFQYEVSSDNRGISSWLTHNNYTEDQKYTWDYVLKGINEEIDGVPSPLSVKQLKTIASLVRFERKQIGLDSLDVELLLTGDEICQVQLRPALKSFLVNNNDFSTSSNVVDRSKCGMGNCFSSTGKIILFEHVDHLSAIIANAKGHLDAKYIVAMPPSGINPYMLSMLGPNQSNFKGFTQMDYSSELTHGDTPGLSSFVRHMPFASFPELRQKIEPLLTEKVFLDLDGEQIEFKATRDLYTLQSRDGRNVEILRE